jgi:cytochrome P450
VTVAEFNPLAPDMAVDPYPAYRALRETAPGVHQIGGLGMYVLSRYDDVAAFYKDRRLEMRYADRETFRYGPTVVEEPFFRYFVQMAHVADNPQHRRLRTMFQRSFTPPRVAAMRPQIKAVAQRLVRERIDDGGMEFISGFAEPFPREVIGDMIGVPAEDNAHIGHLALELGPAFEFLPLSDERKAIVNDGAAELMEYFLRLAARRQADPQDDLLTAMVAAAAASDEAVSMEAVAANVILLYIGGHETTSGQVALGLLALHRNPDQLAALCANPALVPGAAEELIRYDTSAQGTGRIAAEDVEYGGLAIPAGSMILSYIASANRDAAVYEEPDALDLARAPAQRILAFGPGPHQCVGHALAPLEVEVFLEVLRETFPTHELATRDPQFRTFPLLRGILTMEVTW